MGNGNSCLLPDLDNDPLFCIVPNKYSYLSVFRVLANRLALNGEILRVHLPHFERPCVRAMFSALHRILYGTLSARVRFFLCDHLI